MLAGIDPGNRPLLEAALQNAGEAEHAVIAPLDIRALGKLHPNLVIGDLDGVATDPLEFLRQLRFVLPNCTIAVYSADLHRAWGVALHLAGANGILAKTSTGAELYTGVHDAVTSGCYTDPRFVE